jgi:hypothetical protein
MHSLRYLGQLLAGVALVLALVAAFIVARARGQDAPGMTVERVHASIAPEIDVGDRMITIVRFDLHRYALRFLTARDGTPRPLDAWMRDQHLAAGINAGMFLADGRPCGFMRSHGEVIQARTPESFHGVIAFDPLRATSAPLAMGGIGCPGTLASLSASHDSILQSRTALLDCQGQPTDWRTRRYSAAALGVDRQGRAVMVHVRTPYRMQVLARMLSAPELGLRGLVYMEGGPEASLMVDAEGQHVGEMGSWEDGFHEADDNQEYWDLPNVIGVVAR